MTDHDKILLAEYSFGIISEETLCKRFSIDLSNDADYINSELKFAIGNVDEEDLDQYISLIWFSGNILNHIDILNELLITPNHTSHQRIARTLQQIASPTTVPYVRKVLEMGYDHLKYSGSESASITKWFSWLLHSIATPDAVDLMKEYSNSADPSIRKEMIYRLEKLTSDKL
jgi:hypothetical protein